MDLNFFMKALESPWPIGDLTGATVGQGWALAPSTGCCPEVAAVFILVADSGRRLQYSGGGGTELTITTESELECGDGASDADEGGERFDGLGDDGK
jgi:hypothetical protein